MDYKSGRECPEGFLLKGVEHFDLDAILSCGQAFRWDKTGENTYRGVAYGLCREITQQGDTLIFHGADRKEFDRVWFDYFDFGRDYGALKAALAKHKHLREAVEFSPGIRVLRQDGWEALCTFIISANNNIPRIKAATQRLCEHFGRAIPGGYDFPSPQALAALTPEDLAPIRCGFRAKYIIDAAVAVSEGRVDLASLRTLPIPEAQAALQTIKGVGPKVAHCALLFGFARVECLPVDVWISRALEAWFPEGLPKDVGEVAGIAQQYIFHYARTGGVL
ncbi:MAG: DNA-3-methyladenine glycosylase 2 family protein [Oscillospiraceae bacterium]|nr:DNA-3-methyladenine glycosylase 2 family protein [Oscillospiraceae bacterium]